MKNTFLNIFKIFKPEKKQKILRAIESFTLTEKLLFYSFVFIFSGSAIYLLVKVNDNFSVEVPVFGGEIREGVIGYPRYINPLISVTDTGRDLTELLYSGLLKSDSDGGLKNDLAKDYTISEDKLTYTFTLKDDLSFHDGVKVTASDVEFTIKKALDPILKSPKAPNWEGVAIKVINDKQIEFTLREPYSPFLQNLTLGILPKHIWEKIDSDAFVFSQFDIEPVGSGPYMIKDIKRDSSGLPLYYHLTPFAKYALGKPHIKDFYIYFYTNEEALVSAFEKGEVSSLNSISPSNILKIKGGNQIIRVPLPRIFALFLNQNQATLFTNKEVRAALSESLDRQAIINTVLLGFGTEALGPLPANVSDEKPTNETPDERIANAKSILEKAGWIKGDDGLLKKVSKKETVNLVFSITTANSPDLKETAEMLKSNWEKLGAKVDIKIFDLADLQQNAIKTRKYDSLLFGEVVGKDLDIFSFWHSSERNAPGLNISMYTNPKVDNLLLKTRGENDETKKLEYLKSAQSEILKDIPAIFIYSPDFIYLVPENLKGLSLQNISSAPERFSNIENWYIKTEKVWEIFR